MTKKLEEMLDLPESREIIEEARAKPAPIVQHTESLRDIAEFDKISSALPAVKGLGKMADEELNDIAERALTAYEDLMDLGMNVEAR
jgi:hypothetical protein